MIVPVLGFDPSMRNWGIARANLDMQSGELWDIHLDVLQPKEEQSKQVRKNSKDLEIARMLAMGLRPYVQKAKIIFVEVPVGSKSARAMASYGMCIGILGSLQAQGAVLVEVSPTEVKRTFTGDPNASKKEMIHKALELYPKVNFPTYQGQISYSKAEHVADALAAIHAGTKTNLFQSLKTLYMENKQ